MEEIAYWRFSGSRDSSGLVDAAVLALLEGDDSAPLAEMAGLRPDANPFEVNALIDQVITELRLERFLDGQLDLIAIRPLCRRVLSGELAPRELTTWAHQHGGHYSSATQLQALAQLDDDLDLAVGAKRQAESEQQVRIVAAQILAALTP